MASADPKQRTIKLGEFRSEYQLQECMQKFADALQEVIDANDMKGVVCNINRSPDHINREDDPGTVQVQLYAKVTCPPQAGSRIGVMELEDLLDNFHQGKKENSR